MAAAGTTPEQLLRLLTEGTAAHTGAEFFAELVRCLARAVGVAGAWVTEYQSAERSLRALAFWFQDRYIDDYRYAIDGTPCEPVITERCLIHYPDRIVELFPRDPDLQKFGAISYLGLPMLDEEGCVLGHLALLDVKTLALDAQVESVFRIFAARATAEMRRMIAERRVRESELRLAHLVESAMDAIVELDDRLTVCRTNASAARLFGEAVGGRPFPALLMEDSARKLRSLAAGLSASKPFTWVAGGCETSDGVPLEASLSRFEWEGEARYTVILRDIRQQLRAQDESEYLREEIAAHHDTHEIAGSCRGMLEVLEAIGQVGPTIATVLITGETGTGKELVARAVHAASTRASRPLVKVNCAAIPASLMESEFFGHEKGAFTGATQRRTGRFGLADGGTIFLDEIGELPLELQPKLLRVLQEGEYEMVGSAVPRRVDVRVIAATNRDLLAEVAAGRFREDLYYRLHVFPIHIPPLRERGDDIAALAQLFARKHAARLGRCEVQLSPDCLRRLRSYSWPGNVRELENVIERAVITARDGQLDLRRVLPVDAARPELAAKASAPRTKADLVELERQNLIVALERCKWKVAGESGAARMLGIPPSTLTSRMKALGIRRLR